ncbi:MAG: DUF4328 domain-containing protein [Alphaproteobacteria bacterium]|nr:MAG: DUF4328 domain-containing protein [Alphaproteobacteria bacterium]
MSTSGLTRPAAEPVLLALGGAAAGCLVLAALASHAAVTATGASPWVCPEVLAVAMLLVLAVTAIVFLRWLAASYRHLMGEGYPMGYTPAQAVIAWFVPFANWVWPFRVLRELLEAVADSRAIDENREAMLLLRLRWWWGLVLFSTIVLPLTAARRLMLSADTAERTRIWLELLGHEGLLAALAAALLLSVLIHIARALSRTAARRPTPGAAMIYRKRATRPS